MTIEEIQRALTEIVIQLEANGDRYAACLVAQSKLDLKRAELLLDQDDEIA